MLLPRQRIFFPAGFGGALFDVPIWKWRSSDLRTVGNFESAFATLVGARSAVAVDSGRQALALVLRALAVPAGSTIAVPAFTYFAVPAAIRDLGYRLLFVDVDIDTFNVTPEGLSQALEAHPETRVAIVTHMFGVPARARELAELCSSKGVALLEDCAHAAGSTVGGRFLGTFGSAGFFSLEVSKQINAMAGGVAVTNDQKLSDALHAALPGDSARSVWKLARSIARQTIFTVATSAPGFATVTYPAERLFAALGRDLEGREVNATEAVLTKPAARLHPFRAALALAQLPDVGRENARRSQLARLLDASLDPQVVRQRFDASAPPLLCFTLLPKDRDALAAELLRQGIDTKRDYMTNCHAAFGGLGSGEAAGQISARALQLPFFLSLTEREILRMATLVNEAWARTQH